MNPAVKLFGGLTLGIAGIYYLCEHFRKPNHENMKNTYKKAYESNNNKERREAIAKILKGNATENPPKSEMKA